MQERKVDCVVWLNLVTPCAAIEIDGLTNVNAGQANEPRNCMGALMGAGVALLKGWVWVAVIGVEDGCQGHSSDSVDI